jgi:hypothetical protein
LAGGVWEKGFIYLRQAGDKARQTHATQESMAFYTHAIEASEQVAPPLDAAQLLPVYEGRGLVRMLLTNYDAALADSQQMCQMARASGNLQKEGESLSHLAYVHWLAFSEAHAPLVEQHAQETLQLADQTGDQKIRASSLISLAHRRSSPRARTGASSMSSSGS